MNKHSVIPVGAMLLSSALASVVLAQSSSPQPSAPTESPAPQVTMTPPKTSGGYTATFVGCVERQASAGQSTSADSAFMLTHAIRGTAETTPATVGTSGKASEGPQERTYKLDASAPTLTPHVGHKVEVTGLVTVVLGGTAVATSDSALAALSGAPQVKVENIRTVSDTCEPPR